MPELQRFQEASSMRQFSREQRKKGKRIALVPTMVSKHVYGLDPTRQDVPGACRVTFMQGTCL